MTDLLFALIPFVVSGLTSLIKRIPVLTSLSDGPYTWIVRFIAALLSFLGVLGAYIATGTLDASALTTFALALMTFIGATGVHFLGKKK